MDGQQHQDDHDRLGVAAGAHVHHELQTRAVLSRAAGHVTQHKEQLAQVGAPGDVGQREVGEQRAVIVGVRAAVPDVPRRAASVITLPCSKGVNCVLQNFVDRFTL